MIPPRIFRINHSHREPSFLVTKIKTGQAQYLLFGNCPKLAVAHHKYVVAAKYQFQDVKSTLHDGKHTVSSLPPSVGQVLTTSIVPWSGSNTSKHRRSYIVDEID